MDLETARARLEAERTRLRQQLAAVNESEAEDRQFAIEQGDEGDAAQSLTAEGIDEAVATSFQDRLAAVERALRRIDEGTYGRSVRSGLPIPEGRLDADPAAELTVEESAEREAGR